MSAAVEALKALGLTEEQVIDKLITKMAGDILDERSEDDDERSHYRYRDTVMARLQERITTEIRDSVDQIADEHVLPRVEEIIRNFAIQRTNGYGEKRGEPKSFTEYLVERAEAYVTEPVNYEGKAQRDSGGYSWTKSTNRITFMIEKYLHHSIETAIRQAVGDLNTQVAKGLNETVKEQIAKVMAGLRVEVKTK